MEQEHKRRVRYKGTHPRSFKEKYKELNPEKYQDDVQKIIRSGKTPAGMHISIMVDEILEFLQIQPGQTGLDATLGYGGHTRKMLDESGEFTVNIPYGEVDSKILAYCGTKSGRDTDKIADLGLELVDSDVVSVPGIRQLPLTLECKVHCSSIQNIPMLPEEILSRYYPQGVDSSNPGRNEDFHVAYYGEIVNAYLITD